jgi:hypothetical protein
MTIERVADAVEALETDLQDRTLGFVPDDAAPPSDLADALSDASDETLDVVTRALHAERRRRRRRQPGERP